MEYLLLQQRQVSLDYRPNSFVVDTKVMMYEHVSEANGVCPNLIRVTQTEGLREPSASLTNDSEVMENPNLDKFVVVEKPPGLVRSTFRSALSNPERLPAGDGHPS